MKSNPFDKLGETVRRASDETTDAHETVHRAKERALAKWQHPSALTKTRIVTIVAFACAAIALFFTRASTSSRTITYTVGPSDSAGALGAWIAAGKSAIPVHFSEGTLVTLEPGARARVTGADAHGATMLVEQGRAHAKVVHVGQTTSWLVHAGPFDVNVVGTEFDVAWDPTREVFDIHVTEGKVLVRGPLLDGARAVSASEILRVDVHHKSTDAQMDPPHVQPIDEPQQPAIPAPNEDEPAKKAENVAPAPTLSLDKPFSSHPTWQKLAAAGKHKEALEAAEQAGFDHILATSSTAALLELADEARFAGSPDRARQVLLRAREMGARGRTAFLLGKLAADNDQDPAHAIPWFQRYLEESPSGGLAEQALGRIVEIENQRGHREDARKAAQSYLQRYPGGAYETLARRVVEP